MWWERSEIQLTTDEDMGTIYGIESEGKQAETRSAQCRQSLQEVREENEELDDSFKELHSNVHIFVNSIGKQKE